MRNLIALSLFSPLLIAATGLTGEQAARAFGSRPAVESIRMSPDGSKVVFLEPLAGQGSLVYSVSLADGQPKAVTRAGGDPLRMQWCDWVNNERLICELYGVSRSGQGLLGFSRLIAIDADGSDMKELKSASSGDATRRSLSGGEVLDWLEGKDPIVLMARDYVEDARSDFRLVQKQEGLGVDRMDTRTARGARVEKPREGASAYMSDGYGNVRIMATSPNQGATGYLSGRTNWSYRTKGSDQWRTLGFEEYRAPDSILPRAIDYERDAVYVLKQHQGRNALFRIALDGSMATELVYAHPRYEIDDVVTVGKQVIGVRFVADRGIVVYFDKDYAALAAALSKSIPNLPLISFVDASYDGSKVLIQAESDTDPGRFYVYDKAKRTLNETMLVRPMLEQVPLANVRTVSYKAADGAEVPAYLTLPPGSGGKNLPAIVMPHGGPWSRDEWGFDWLAQFFANQGYAVLQPNFRGSTGYGDEWFAESGFKSWKLAIGDINAGARWLASSGIAAPEKLAIVGWSYGGYAALQANVVEPSIYKAAIAIAPVTDLPQFQEEKDVYVSGKWWRDMMGTGPHLQEGSPARHVARIAAPVLLFHGDHDLNVHVNQARTMDRRLKEAGKASELVVYPGLDHQLEDGAARRDMLAKASTFLRTHLK